MRRRKSSCPNIEPRRTSATPNRNAIKLDLYIEDDELHPGPGGARRNSPSPTTMSDSSRRRSSSTTTIEDTAEEVLCLRLLSTRTRYRFGGLRVNLISPVFNVDKLFNVEFDQDSQISLIKSQQSSYDQAEPGSYFEKPIPQSQQNEGRCATIVIEPESEDQKDEITRQLPLMVADLTVVEVPDKSPRKNKSHISARSLTRIPEPEIETVSKRPSKRHQSTSSIYNSNSNNGSDSTSSIAKFDSVKVYAQVEPPDPSLLESINLESFKKFSINNPGNSSKSNRSSSTIGDVTTRDAGAISLNNNNNNNSNKTIQEMRRHTHYHLPTTMMMNKPP